MKRLILVVGALGLAGGQASADAIHDLRAGGSAPINGAVFQTTEVATPAGSGKLQSFVRLEKHGNDTFSHGHNTDGTLAFNENNSGAFTHSLLLSSLVSQDVGGVESYAFVLDINQNSGIPDAQLSINNVQIFGANVGDLTGSKDINGNFTGIAGASLLYNMDAAPHNDARVDLNYDLRKDAELGGGGGSGRVDMFLYVPVSVFANSGPYVYLYSHFGTPGYPNNDGYEEWAAMVTLNTPDPGASPAPRGCC